MMYCADIILGTPSQYKQPIVIGPIHKLALMQLRCRIINFCEIHWSVFCGCFFIEHKTTSNVVKTVGLSSKGSSRKRKHSSSEEEDSRASQLHSIVKVKDRKLVIMLCTHQ